MTTKITTSQIPRFLASEGLLMTMSEVHPLLLKMEGRKIQVTKACAKTESKVRG
jgi:hypothetical protein